MALERQVVSACKGSCSLPSLPPIATAFYSIAKNRKVPLWNILTCDLRLQNGSEAIIMNVFARHVAFSLKAALPAGVQKDVPVAQSCISRMLHRSGQKTCMHKE